MKFSSALITVIQIGLITAIVIVTISRIKVLVVRLKLFLKCASARLMSGKTTKRIRIDLPTDKYFEAECAVFMVVLTLRHDEEPRPKKLDFLTDS